jgi:AcrR family transcriptional regulator
LQVTTGTSEKKKEEEASARAPRADVARNRARLLVAAEALFKERGADASFDDIAKRAGVGIGTVYRHFRSHEELLAAACDERLMAVARASRARDETMGVGDAFRAYLIDLVRHASMYRGLAASLGVVLKSHTPGCYATTEEGVRLLALAQKAGAVRRDVSLDDVVCLAMAVSLAVAGEARPKARIERLVGLFLDGITRG